MKLPKSFLFLHEKKHFLKIKTIIKVAPTQESGFERKK